MTVESYDPVTGIVELVEPLQGYHFGARESTENEYSGVDMRGEVLLLSSNVNITADIGPTSQTLAHPEPYGGHILVSDFFEPEDMTYRAGSIIADNIAINHMSQLDKSFGGIKFHYATKGEKRVTNSALSQGHAGAILIGNSKGVILDGNVIHDHQQVGIAAWKSHDLTVTNNVVSWIRPYNADKPSFLTWAGNIGGILITGSDPYLMKDNIVAGAWHTGFFFPSKGCGDASVHTGNVAHSISGYGAIVNSGASKVCSEFGDFKGYKNHLATVHMGGGTKSKLNKVRDIVSIDSAVGLMAFGTGGGRVEVEDVVIYGSKDMPNEDCIGGASCYTCMSKHGIMMPTFGGHATGVSAAPKNLKHMVEAGGSWKGSSLYRRVQFIGFDKATQSCGQG